VVDFGEQLDELCIACPALDGQGALARCGDHVIRLEDLADHVGVADPGKSRVGEHHRVQLSLTHLCQPGPGVSPDRNAGDVGSQHRELRGAAR
jgi:hypothetical protein